MNTPQTWRNSPIHEKIKNMNTQPTPDTDAAYKNHAADLHDHIPLDFARKLERERDEAREKIESSREWSAVLADIGDDLRSELTAVTEQRDKARRLAEKYRNLSCDSQDEADETLLPWETTNPNEL
jgi:hypothetical protein